MQQKNVHLYTLLPLQLVSTLFTLFLLLRKKTRMSLSCCLVVSVKLQANLNAAITFTTTDTTISIYTIHNEVAQ